jgi:hypothetical protein
MIITPHTILDIIAWLPYRKYITLSAVVLAALTDLALLLARFTPFRQVIWLPKLD